MIASPTARRFGLCLTLAWLSAGCATVDSVRDAPETAGEERTYGVAYDRMTELVARTLPSIDLAIVSRDVFETKQTLFMATSPMKWNSWGEIVRVTVSEVDASNATVAVHWRHNFNDGLMSPVPDWKGKVFTAIEERLP